ncbi:hypothetical protein CPC197_1077 [Chlamydia psittaci C1/97]|nr:hypothetical protein CPC197_1077 [Chlamydia psittaci C1/97]
MAPVYIARSPENVSCVVDTTTWDGKHSIFVTGEENFHVAGSFFTKVSMRMPRLGRSEAR